MEPRAPFLGRWVQRAVSSDRILAYLAAVTFALSAAAGILIHWIDKESFPTVGTGIWWAVVTFCTVGYGDYVPNDSLGRFVAGVVMVFAITFITVITALVTSALVAGEQRRRAESEGARYPAIHEALARIEERLEKIESQSAAPEDRRSGA